MKKFVSLMLVLVLLAAMLPHNALSSAATVAMADEEALELGIVNGKTYWNSSLTIGCRLTADWRFADEDEIKEINGLTQDLLKEDLKAKLNSMDVLRDMYAENLTTGESVTVSVEKIGSLNGVLMSERSYLDAGTPDLESGLANMGFEKIHSESVTVTFAGEEHAAVAITAATRDGSFNQTVVAVKNGKYMIVVSAASTSEEATAAILDTFFISKDGLPFSQGTNDGTTYTNAFLGLSCTLGGNWEFYTDRQIESMNKDALEAMGLESSQALENVLTDMIAENSAADARVEVTVKQISPMINAQFYRDSVAEQKRQEMRSSGMLNIKADNCRIAFQGQVCAGARLSGTSDGTPFYETLVVSRVGDYLFCICAASMGSDTTDQILDSFSAK